MSAGPKAINKSAAESLPNFLQRRSTDEYRPEPYSPLDLEVVAQTASAIDDAAEKRHQPNRFVAAGRAGTAAGLQMLNRVYDTRFFELPDEALLDEDAANHAFSSSDPLFDVQTHFVGPEAQASTDWTFVTQLYDALAPDWWTDLPPDISYDLATYLQKVLVETENAVVILTSAPVSESQSLLSSRQIAAARALVDRFAGSGRLLNHAIVRVGQPGEVESMEEWRDTLNPVGWKVYTANRGKPGGGNEFGWMLDSEETGVPFLQNALDLGVRVVCSHKGISRLADNGSPRDIGPSAKAFPELSFLVYHSGYEFPLDNAPPEGPYVEDVEHFGVDRLIDTAREAGIGVGGNIYAELGTTWYALIRRPVQAAHVIGKLISAFGEDNVIWGTDSMWYGAAQPLVDAFRVFQIPERMCEEFGYAPLTPEVRAKILGGNAARVYGVDLASAQARKAADDANWADELLEAARRTDLTESGN